VVHVCDFASDQPGNFVPSQQAAAERTREALGRSSHFVFPEQSRGAAFVDDLGRAGFGVTFVDRSRGHASLAAELARLARALRAEIVHSHFTGLDMECLWAARRASARTIWHLHSGIYPYTAARRASDLVKVRLAGRACDHVIACAEWVGEQAVERGFRRERVTTVANAIALDRYRPSEMASRDEARRRFGLPAERPIALAFCWTPERKGADLLLGAGAGVAGLDGPAAPLLVLVGSGALEGYVSERIGDERPEWLRIMPPVEDVPTLLRAADVFVNASRHEGMPYAIGEAMAAGLPVVASDIPGSRFYLSAPGLTAFRTEDAAALEHALRATLLAGDLEGRGAANREFALERLGIGRYADEIVAVYRGLLAGA
jgi:glycosyltransferase involved in cell wall biosynthesis